MKSGIKITFFLFVVNISVLAYGQSTDSASVITALSKSIKYDGVIKAKLETSANDGSMRFNIRNSRLGIRGDVSEYVSYRVQMEFSNECVFSPLDLYGVLKPANGLNVSFGQLSIPFENQYIISPSEMMFANRAFIGKYFTPGTRDIGAVVKYDFPFVPFPLEGEIGMFNGGKINNPQWTNSPSYAARLVVGKMDGFRASAKLYRYTGETVEMTLWGADLHYANQRLRLQAEVMNRMNHTTSPDLFGTYIQGTYIFNLNAPKMFHSMSPTFRWDAMGYNVMDSGLDVNRLTFGINFGLDLKPFDSTLRLNYEQYFVRNGYFAEFDNRDLHVADNKVTIELLIRF